MEDLTVDTGEVLPGSSRRWVRVSPRLHRAVRLLRPHLVAVARAGSTTTYAEAAAACDGAYPPRGLGPALTVLGEDCRRRGEPPLAALVVRAGVGEVGSGFVGDAPADRRACWAYWAGRGPGPQVS